MSETIAAIATPFGEGAIALLRLSRPRAVEIARAAFAVRGKGQSKKGDNLSQMEFWAIHALDTIVRNRSSSKDVRRIKP